MSDKRVTLKHVAEAAGVSMITASNVLGGKKLSHASSETQQRVRDAAAKLGYRPNLAARQLATGKNNIIGLLIDSQAPQFYWDVMAVIERLAYTRGYRLQVGLVHDDLPSIQKYVDDLLGSAIENIICMTHAYPKFGEKVPRLFDAFPNVVFIEEPMAETAFSIIAADHYQNYLMITRYLLNLNRKRIFNLRGDYRDSAFYASSKGFKDAYAEQEIEYHDSFMHICPNYAGFRDYDSARLVIESILPLNPEAMIVSNDEALLWCTRVLNDKQIRVPEDISLLSANLSRYGLATTPSITGIDYNAEKFAMYALEAITNNLSKDGIIRQIKKKIEARLVEGESCCSIDR